MQILYLPISPAPYRKELAFRSKFHCFFPCKLSNPKEENFYLVCTGSPKALPSVDAMEPSDRKCDHEIDEFTTLDRWTSVYEAVDVR